MRKSIIAIIAIIVSVLSLTFFIFHAYSPQKLVPEAVSLSGTYIDNSYMIRNKIDEYSCNEDSDCPITVTVSGDKIKVEASAAGETMLLWSGTMKKVPEGKGMFVSYRTKDKKDLDRMENDGSPYFFKNLYKFEYDTQHHIISFELKSLEDDGELHPHTVTAVLEQ